MADSLQLQAKLELGHSASCRKKLTPEGYTHDWVVFVRGPDNKDISHFVDKVVFNLHESFPRPKRVFKEPPYSLEASGYGTFILPIDIYFKNKEEPKKVRLQYDLTLPAIGMPPITNIRSEALKFINPPEEFKKKVLKSGGEVISGVNGVSSPLNAGSSSSVAGNPSMTTSSNGKEMRKDHTNDRPHTETEKPKKIKTEKLEKTTSNKQSNKAMESSSSSSSVKRPSTSGEDGHVKKKKKIKIERDSSPSLKPIGFIPIELPPAGSNEKDRILESKDMKVKIKSMPPKSEKTNEKQIAEKSIKKKAEKGIDSIADNSPGGNTKKRKSSSSSIKSKEKPAKTPSETKPKLAKVDERKLEKITFRRSSGDSWSSSSSGSSGLFNTTIGGPVGKNNALGTLMAELVNGDDDNDDDSDDNEFLKLATPFQSSPPKHTTEIKTELANNNHSPTVVNKTSASSKPSKGKTKHATYHKKQDGKGTTSKLNGIKSSPSTGKVDGSKSQSSSLTKPSPKHTKTAKDSKANTNGHQPHKINLIQLHKRLSATKDSNCLQKVADILEQSGCYQLTDTSLYFDLHSLDMETVKKIEECFER